LSQSNFWFLVVAGLVALAFWTGRRWDRPKGQFGDLTVLLACRKCGHAAIEPTAPQVISYFEGRSFLVRCPRCHASAFVSRSDQGRFYEPDRNLWGYIADDILKAEAEGVKPGEVLTHDTTPSKGEPPDSGDAGISLRQS
jgi:hypothetical protein